jgi:hypothetical protein
LNKKAKGKQSFSNYPHPRRYTMTESKTKSKDQFEDTLDQINSNTSEAFDLLTKVNKEFEKLGGIGIDETAAMAKSGQKVSKDLIKSTVDTANEAVKAAKSCVEGTLNLLKR